MTTEEPKTQPDLTIEEQLAADERRQRDEERQQQAELDAKYVEVKVEYKQLVQAENPSLIRVKEVNAIMGVDASGFTADRLAWKRSREIPNQVPSDEDIQAAVTKAQAANERWNNRGIELQALTDEIQSAHQQAAGEVRRLTDLKKQLEKQLASDRESHHRIFD